MGSIGLPHRGGSIITHRLHVGNLVGTSEVLHYLCLMRHALAYMSRGSCLQSACRKAIFTYFVFQSIKNENFQKLSNFQLWRSVSQKHKVPQGKKRATLTGIMTNYMRGSIFVQIGVIMFSGSLILRQNNSLKSTSNFSTRQYWNRTYFKVVSLGSGLLPILAEFKMDAFALAF